MKVLVMGGGQLACALQRTTPKDLIVQVLTRQALDITDAKAVQGAFKIERPDVVVNTAAYTAVDRAEHDREAAFAVNGSGAGHVARAAQAIDARVVHLSTDFVFDGSRPVPYGPEDPANPLGVYGASKLAGEREVFAAAPSALVLRTAWLYAAGGRNFVHTVLRLCGEREALQVVMDQLGSPTWAETLAGAIWQAVGLGIGGLHHWTDSGVASWYDFAVAIQEEALALGLLRRAIPIRPIRSAEYPTPARRPAYSVLDTRAFSQSIGQTPAHWRENLRRMLQGLADA